MRNEPSDPTATVDRLPPHSLEMEQGVLGCILIDPQKCIPECVERFPGVEVFYDLRHQTIYQTMLELWDDRDPVDILSLQDRLQVWGTLEQCGGIAYIATLPDAVPSATNVSYYADVVREKYLLRQMVRVCTEAVSRIYDFEGEADTLMDEVERDVLRVSETRAIQNTPEIRELVTQAINDIEATQTRQGAITGLATGFIDYDRYTSGLQQGEMTVIAARPSMGKTSLAMNIAENVAVNLNLPVAVFSLEMTAKALVNRMLLSRSRVNIRNVRDGFLAERDYPKITNAAGDIAKASLYIDDSSGLSILQLRAKARRLWQKYGVKLFVIDYLQLLNAIGGKRRVESRQQEVADISAGIKGLAKELNVPVIVLSQLNRDVEKEKNRKPRLADLRESGAIEQDADVVGFLYKPPMRDDEEEGGPYEEAVPVNWLIAKQRNGPAQVEVPLIFIKAYTRFESAAKVTEEDVPAEQTQQPELPTT